MNARMWIVMVSVPALIAILVIYLPKIFQGSREHYSRQEFIERYPKFDWLQWDIWLDFILFVFLMLGYAGAVMLFQDTPFSLSLFSIVPAGLALANGIFIATTGIYRVPHRYSFHTYFYEPALRYVGWLQLCAASLVIMATLILVAMTRPI